jgi:hypothetical protein
VPEEFAHIGSERSAAALACGELAAAPSASAACVSFSPWVAWSRPAQGGTGVPTNVDLWILTADWPGLPRVRLGEASCRRSIGATILES